MSRLSEQQIIDIEPIYATSYSNNRISNIIEKAYADIPFEVYTSEHRKRYANDSLFLDKNMIQSLRGDIYIYKLAGEITGEIYTNKSGEILCGNIYFTYSNRISIDLNLIYGNSTDGINIISWTNPLKVFSSYNRRISVFQKEMERNLIEKILNKEFKDYSETVENFLIACRKFYYIKYRIKRG